MTASTPRLSPANVLAVLAISACCAAGVAVALSGYALAWREYFVTGFVVTALLCGQAVYTYVRPDRRIALTLQATAMLVLFSVGSSILNYALLALKRPNIDAWLASLDNALGFHWPSFIETAATLPFFVTATKFAYASSLYQIALLTVCLGLTGRLTACHRFAAALMCGSLITVAVWAAFPSYGTTILYDVPPDLAPRLSVGPDYGRELLRLMEHGPSIISPADMQGLVAFPSFHTVLALLCVYGALQLPKIALPLIPLNLLVVASVPLHGGHHLVDVFGGVVTFALALAIAFWIVPASRSSYSAPEEVRLGASPQPAELAVGRSA